MASYALDGFRRRLLHQAGVRKRYDPIEAPQRHRNETQSQERKRPPRIALTCSKNFLCACSLWLMGWEAALLHLQDDLAMTSGKAALHLRRWSRVN